MASGLVIMAAPFLLGFSPAGLVISVALGAVIFGLALTAVPVDGRPTPVSAHFAYDRGIAFGLLGGGLVLALGGDAVAAVFLTGAAIVQGALNLITRYTARA
jgi:hypothetical protein